MPPKNSLVVKNMNSVKQSDYKNLHEKLCRPPFFSVICGARHSGKSNLVKNLILRDEFYSSIFDYEDIFYISSTVFIDDSCDDLPPEINKFDKYDNSMIEDIMAQCKEIKNENGKEDIPNILLIIDDLGAEGKVMGRGGFMEGMSFTSRHYNISCFILVQKYSSVCPGIRGNSDLQIFFRPMNLGGIDSIIDEHSDKKKKKNFYSMLEYVWDKPYQFLVICFKKEIDNGRYMKNFDEILVLDNFIPIEIVKKNKKNIKKDIV